MKTTHGLRRSYRWRLVPLNERMRHTRIHRRLNPAGTRRRLNYVHVEHNLSLIVSPLLRWMALKVTQTIARHPKVSENDARVRFNGGYGRCGCTREVNLPRANGLNFNVPNDRSDRMGGVLIFEKMTRIRTQTHVRFTSIGQQLVATSALHRSFQQSRKCWFYTTTRCSQHNTTSSFILFLVQLSSISFHPCRW